MSSTRRLSIAKSTSKQNYSLKTGLFGKITTAEFDDANEAEKRRNRLHLIKALWKKRNDSTDN